MAKALATSIPTLTLPNSIKLMYVRCWRYSGNWFNELGRPYFEGVSQCDDVQQGDIALATLDSADVVAVQIGQLRQLLLREAAFEPERADSLSEHHPRVWGSHPAIMGSLTTMSLHTISVIQISTQRGQHIIPRRRRQ